MEVIRVNPEDGFIREFNEYRNRVKSLETKPAGAITIRETLKTTDPNTGVETIIGELPDGSFGFEQFIGDIEPPPIATKPTVKAQPGVFVIWWDGALSGPKPRDFQHVNVIGRKIVGGVAQSPVQVGVIRLGTESVFVSTDIAAVGDTWRFTLQSEDYNGNLAAESPAATDIVMKSAVTDTGVNEALQGIATDILNASNKAVSAQNAANTAQSAADAAAAKADATIASGTSLTINGNFESPNNLGWPTFLSTVIENSSASARSGTKVLRATVGSAARYAYTDYIAGATGRTYYVEFYIRLRETVVVGAESLKIGALFSYLTSTGTSSAAATYGDNGEYGGIPQSLGTLTTSWKKFATSYTFTTPDVQSVRFGPRIPGSTVLGNTVEIDDFKVIDITEAALAQTKADQAFNSALSAASAAGSAQTSADSKNRVWYTATPPAGIGHLTGDTWYDTSNGNRINIWTGPTGTPPNAWVNVQDEAIKAAQNAATGAQASANSKVTNYYQTSKPTGGTYKAGDQWYDTDDSYKLYVYVTTPAVNGVSNDWVPFADGPISEIKNNVTSVTQTATGALAVANGKNKSYVGSSAPTPSANNVVGDLWIDTGSGNLIKRWNGSSWGSYRDTTIQTASDAASAALGVANGKNSSYVGTTAPAASASTIGDLWIDTGNNNMIRRYAGGGVWTDYRDLTIAAAAQTASAAQTSANGKNRVIYSTSVASGTAYASGDTWFQRDPAKNNAIIGQWEFTTSWQPRQIENAQIANLDGGKITFGTMSGDALKANTVDISKLTVGSFDNLITEPTFLNSGSAWVTAAGLYTIDPTGARNGGPAFKITNAASQQGRYNQSWLPIEGGQSYRMMAWVKSDVSIPVSAISLFTRTRNKSGTITPGRAGANDKIIPADTWTPVYGTRKLPDDAVEVSFGIYKESSLNTGSTWFDYVSATRMAGGELIVDGSITAGSAIIADAAISSAQIISLNAAKVSATWLEGGFIKANSIQTPMLAVSDLNSFAPSYAEDPSAWRLDGGMVTVTSTTVYDKVRFRSMVTSGTQRAMGPYMAVQPGDQLYAEGIIYRSSGNTAPMYLRYYYYDANKTYLTSGGEIFDGPNKGTSSTSSSVTNQASGTTFKITATVPDNVNGVIPMYAHVVATIINTAGTDTGFYNLKAYRRFGGSLLVDGTIAANSGIIGDLAVDTAQIANGAITSLKVTEMSADRIKSGFLDTNRLLAGSIGADKIVVGVGYNLAYNGSAQQTGFAAGGTADPTAPTAGYSGWIRATSNPPTGYAAYWTTTAGQGTTSFLNAPAIPVKPNTNYRVNVWVKADIAGSRTYLEPLTGSTAAGHRIMYPYPNPDGSYSQMTYAFSNAVVPTEWTPWTVEFRTGIAPAQTMYFRWFVNHTNGSTTNSVFSFTGFELIEMTAGELLVNGAIKTQHMTAGSIDGGIISAGTLKALQIGSKEISVDKLLVTSTDNMIQDADFTGSGKGWFLASDSVPYPGFSINATAGRNSAPALQVANNATQQETWNASITSVDSAGLPVKTRLAVAAAGKQTYRVSAWVKSTVSVPVSGIKILTRYVNQSGAATFGFATYVTPGTKTPATIAANTWTEISGQVTTPDDNVTISFGIQSASNLSSGTLYVDFISATRASDGQLIVDGAITTNHMTAGTIDGAVITAETLSGSQFKAKSIQADRLVISSTDNLILEADFTNNGSSWGLPSSNWSIVSTAGRGSGPALRVTGTTALRSVTNVNNRIPVGSEDHFRGSFYVKSSAAATAGKYKLRMRAYTSAATGAAPAGTYDVAVSTALTAGQWKLVEGFSPDLPANTISVEFFLEATNAATGTTTDFDYVAVTRAADGKLVVDGAIDGKIITGATFQTSTSVATSGGIIFDLTGFRAYNPAGQQTFGISGATGNVSSTGQFSTKTEQVSSGGGTMSIGATFGTFTYNTSTDFSGIPGIEFSRVHSTEGAKDPARIFYDGKSIILTTWKDANAFTPNFAGAEGSFGEGWVRLTSARNSTTQAASELIPTANFQMSTPLNNPGMENASMVLDYKLGSYWKRSGVKIDAATGGAAYAGSGRYGTGIIHEHQSPVAGAMSKSQMVVNDNGIWMISGQRNSDGAFVTMVNSQADGSGVSTGVLGLHGINKVVIGHSFDNSGKIEVTPTTTTVTNALKVNGTSTLDSNLNVGGTTTTTGTLTANGALTVNGTATFNSNFVVGSSGTTTLPANTTIGGVAVNWSAITTTTIPYSGIYQGYAGFATPVYYRDQAHVYMAGVVGCNTTSITLAAGSTYTVGVLPAAYRPAGDILFAPLVGATMSPNIVFYVRANGNLQFYSPTTQTLAQSAFYIGLDGMSWLRTQ